MSRRSISRAAVGLVAAIAAELAAIALAVASARALRPAASIAEPDPLDVAARIGAQVAIALLGYLLLVTVAHLVALALQALGAVGIGSRVATAAGRLGPSALTRLAATAAIATTVAACSAPPRTASPGAAASARAVTMELVSPGPSTTGPPEVVTMEIEASPSTPMPAPEQAAAPEPAPTAPAPTAPTPTAPTPTAPTPTVPAPTAPGQTVTVARGESFWTIARRELAARSGRPVGDDEVEHYWRSLVEANRAVLVDPEDPGRLYAGQQLRLP